MRKIILGLALVLGVGSVSDVSIAAPLAPAPAMLQAAQIQTAPDQSVELARYYRHRHCFYRHHRRFCR